MSSNESRWFLVCFGQKSKFAVLAHTLYKSTLGVVRHFSRVALRFWATSRLPVDFSQNWKNEKDVKKRWKSAVFFRMRRAYPRSPDALCAANSWILDGFGMLADAGIDSFQTFTPIWLDHQSRWFLFQAMIFGPKSRKSIVFAKATRN